MMKWRAPPLATAAIMVCVFALDMMGGWGNCGGSGGGGSGGMMCVEATTPPNYGVSGGTVLSAADVAAISADIVATFGLSASYGQSCAPCTQGDNVGAMLRLAWRDAVGGGGPLGQGGPNGCLDTAPTEGGLTTVVATYETILSRWTGKISRADLWVLGATLAVQYASTASGTLAVNGMAASPGTLHLPFQYGRQDEDTCSGLDAPFLTTVAAGMDWNALVGIFGTRFGMTTAEIVAIMGGHSLGRCQTANSGFNGGWSAVQSSFTNLYYSNLALAWNQPTTTSPVWFANQNGQQILMLGVDVDALFSDAATGGCQRWTGFNPGGCTRNTLAGGGTPSSYVVQYAGSITAFYAAFTTAFQKLTELQWNQAAAGGVSALGPVGSVLLPVAGSTPALSSTASVAAASSTSTARISSTASTTHASSTGTSVRASSTAGTTHSSTAGGGKPPPPPPPTCRKAKTGQMRCVNTAGQLVTAAGDLILVNGTAQYDDPSMYVDSTDVSSASSGLSTPNEIAIIASVCGAAAIGMGVTWYCCRQKRLREAKSNSINGSSTSGVTSSMTTGKAAAPMAAPPTEGFASNVSHMKTETFVGVERATSPRKPPTSPPPSRPPASISSSYSVRDSERAPLSPRSAAAAVARGALLPLASSSAKSPRRPASPRPAHTDYSSMDTTASL